MPIRLISPDFLHTFKQLSFDVTQAVSFVNDRDPPRHIAYYIEVPNKRVVGGDEDIELEVVGCVGAIFVVPFILAKDISPYLDQQ